MKNVKGLQRKVSRFTRVISAAYGVGGCIFSLFFLLNFNFVEYDKTHLTGLILMTLISIYLLGVAVFSRLNWFLNKSGR